MLNDIHQFLLIDVREQPQRICQPEAGHDVDIAGVLLIHQGVKSVHHHIESRPVITPLLGQTAIKIEQFPTHTHAKTARRLEQCTAVLILGNEGRRDGVHHTDDMVIGAKQP